MDLISNIANAVTSPRAVIGTGMGVSAVDVFIQSLPTYILVCTAVYTTFTLLIKGIELYRVWKGTYERSK